MLNKAFYTDFWQKIQDFTPTFWQMSFYALICRSPQFLAAQYYFGRRNATALADDAQHGPQMWKPGEENCSPLPVQLYVVMEDGGGYGGYN